MLNGRPRRKVAAFQPLAYPGARAAASAAPARASSPPPAAPLSSAAAAPPATGPPALQVGAESALFQKHALAGAAGGTAAAPPKLPAHHSVKLSSTGFTM